MRASSKTDSSRYQLRAPIIHTRKCRRITSSRYRRYIILAAAIIPGSAIDFAGLVIVAAPVTAPPGVADVSSLHLKQKRSAHSAAVASVNEDPRAFSANRACGRLVARSATPTLRRPRLSLQ